MRSSSAAAVNEILQRGGWGGEGRKRRRVWEGEGGEGECLRRRLEWHPYSVSRGPHTTDQG